MGSHLKNLHTSSSSYPTDIRALLDHLRSGEVTITAAINHIYSFFRDVLGVIGECAEQETRKSLERKTTIDRMDKVINDLSERCQVLQQQLLYKEEKYDEKCREVERYKVVCELSASGAVNDKPTYQSDNQIHLFKNDHSLPDIKIPNIDVRSSFGTQPVHEPNEAGELRHFKMSSSNCGARPVRPEVMNADTESFTGPMANYNNQSLACDYAGGPTSRATPFSSNRDNLNYDMRVKDKLETIGAINVPGPSINSGPVLTSKLERPTYSQIDDHDRRVKISSSGQTNEVMSSSRDGVHRLRQRASDKDRYRQIQAGCWTKFSYRRKKGWPF